MNRPTSHGGGEAGPPIAGDPSSFPTDAELSRTLVEASRTASLSTLTAEGYPYGSVVSYAVDAAGNPVVLISDMAEHTVNARGDDRASMLIVDGAGEGDPLGRARLTLVGRLSVLSESGGLRDRYLLAHPYAAYYADFTDFSFWQLRVEQCRYVGGFGHMSWVSDAGYRDAGVDPLWDAAASIVEHMNSDHAEANLLYAQVQGGLEDATEATMVGVDRYGFTLRVTTPAAPRMARVPFATPLSDADAVRPAVIELLREARAQRGRQ